MKKTKIIDERGFLFGKISVVDILAVLLVLAIGGMVYVRLFVQGKETGYISPEMTKVEFVVKVPTVRDVHKDAYRPGDVVYKGDDGPLLGTVTDVRTEQAYALVTSQDGEILSVPVKDYYDFYITIEAQCTTGANGYYLGNSVELNRNMTLELTTLYDNLTGTVYSIG